MELFRFFHHNSDNHVTIKNVDEKRRSIGRLLIFACFFIYTSSMAVKGIFVAELEYVRTMWNLEFATMSMTNTFYFVAYGLVQVLLFFIISKINIKHLMIITIPISAVCSCLMGVTTNVYQMWAFFGLTGAFQASVYCGCNYMLTRYLPVKQLTSANRVMNLGYAFGTVISYALCALCITYDLWQIPYFVLSGVLGLAVLIFSIVLIKAQRYEKVNKLLDKKQSTSSNGKVKVKEKEKPLFTLETKKKLIMFYAIDLTMAFLITSLYYCVMNYITSLLVDVHGMDKSVSVYVTIIAPIMVALGPMMTISSCDKDRNFIREAILYSLLLIPIVLLLAFFYDLNVWFALVLSVAFVVIANGVKAIVLSVMTFKMRDMINAGAYSAISNAIASISAGVTPTVIGRIIDASGWRAAYFTTLGVASFIILALVIINLIVKSSNKTIKTEV